LDNGVVAVVTLDVTLSTRNRGEDHGGGHRGSDHDASNVARRGSSSSSSSSRGARRGSSSSSSSRGSEFDGSHGDSGGSSSSSKRRRVNEGSDDGRPVQRVKHEQVSPQAPSYSPGQQEEEEGEEEEEEEGSVEWEEEEEEEKGTPVCFNCNADIPDDDGFTDDTFWVWSRRYGMMAWFQHSKLFCDRECHRTALKWTVQGLIPAASTRDLKDCVHVLVV
jgi:hypothetical protein